MFFRFNDFVLDDWKKEIGSKSSVRDFDFDYDDVSVRKNENFSFKY